MCAPKSPDDRFCQAIQVEWSASAPHSNPDLTRTVKADPSVGNHG
jgi:hypothetical protein